MNLNPGRRAFLLQLTVTGLALPPFAALLSACSRAAMPVGMAEIEWDRDSCTRCRMVISDRRFAAEVRGGPDDNILKFDDIGCAVSWLARQPWGNDPRVRIWVAAATSKDDPDWLEARSARYVPGMRSPMRYDLGAVAVSQAGSQGFEDMRRHVLAAEK